MAKKTRIDRRGKIRSLTRKQPPIVRLQWRKGKTLAVLARRRFIDDVFISDDITVTDSLFFHWYVFGTSSVTATDVANIDDQKVVISSTTLADTDGITKNYEQPANTSTATVTDSIGFVKADFNIQFNNNVFNFALLNGIGYDQEAFTDSMTVTDGVVLSSNEVSTSSTNVTDSIGFVFNVGSVLNGSEMNLSQLNS